ncbi:MAG: hypothetical protein Ctma_1516 [Catillopecten margaritatus gill symbiont]|uniref:Toxin-antitoxin system HicB family antitoxin n=1 Tax=Catillopecten margaritatus gill symbiont TaxID=3083288 RepID=A0AAU6PIC3_9GAMM
MMNLKHQWIFILKLARKIIIKLLNQHLEIDPKEHAELAQVARQNKISVNALVHSFITDRLNFHQ